MWNPYEIEKRYEEHVREIEKHARRAHWYAHEGRIRRVPLGLAGGAAAVAALVMGYYIFG